MYACLKPLNYFSISLKERFARSAMKAKMPKTINNNKVKNPKWEDTKCIDAIASL